jgi:hypothetical protein
VYGGPESRQKSGLPAKCQTSVPARNITIQQTIPNVLNASMFFMSALFSHVTLHPDAATTVGGGALALMLLALGAALAFLR